MLLSNDHYALRPAPYGNHGDFPASITEARSARKDKLSFGRPIQLLERMPKLGITS
ncbi:hypothetical protein MBHK15_111024 [Marinobacter salarius]|nr:hypothetical protein MBHK15_111024 [Marinobacter salarius]